MKTAMFQSLPDFVVFEVILFSLLSEPRKGL